jgi:uncharacterized membrane protein
MRKSSRGRSSYMNKGRLEAFNDAVLAIAMTILVLQLAIPLTENLSEIWSMGAALAVYALSFLFLANFWVSHYHMMHPIKSIDGICIWMDVFMLLFLCLVPFTTAWAGKNLNAFEPALIYALVFFFALFFSKLFAMSLIRHDGRNSAGGRALQKEKWFNVSLVASAVIIGLAFISPPLVYIGSFLISILWTFPNKDVRKLLKPNVRRNSSSKLKS